MKKVSIFMSGGVDSSLSSVLLKEKGYEILGVTAKFLPCSSKTTEKSCCSLENIQNAKDIAAKFSFKHITIDLESDFKKHVIDDFYKTYIKGKTPNPCIRCNEHVKIKALFENTKKLGYPFFATGHYSKIFKCAETGRFYLQANFNDSKDQSYFLFVLTQEILSKMILPLTGLNKEKVRSLASTYNLIVKDKKESQEICFVPNNNYNDFLYESFGLTPVKGNILDLRGTVIGTHKGIWNFTIGQRKGLGISSTNPLYVLSIDAKKNEIIVGEKEFLKGSDFLISGISYMKVEKIPVDTEILVKIRSTSPPISCKVKKIFDNKALVNLKTPALSVTPGQAAVFFDFNGDLLFGGWIE